jgi:hypothetical protein
MVAVHTRARLGQKLYCLVSDKNNRWVVTTTKVDQFDYHLRRWPGRPGNCWYYWTDPVAFGHSEAIGDALFLSKADAFNALSDYHLYSYTDRFKKFHNCKSIKGNAVSVLALRSVKNYKFGRI